MNTYKYQGRMGKGFSRILRDRRREDAYRRALAVWNDGTGMYQRKPTDVGLTRVAHPIIFLPVSDPRRQTFVAGNALPAVSWI
jgi:hypothetical protein